MKAEFTEAQQIAVKQLIREFWLDSHKLGAVLPEDADAGSVKVDGNTLNALERRGLVKKARIGWHNAARLTTQAALDLLDNPSFREEAYTGYAVGMMQTTRRAFMGLPDPERSDDPQMTLMNYLTRRAEAAIDPAYRYEWADRRMSAFFGNDGLLIINMNDCQLCEKQSGWIEVSIKKIDASLTTRNVAHEVRAIQSVVRFARYFQFVLRCNGVPTFETCLRVAVTQVDAYRDAHHASRLA